MHDLLEEMGTRIALENSSRLCIQKGEDIPGVFMSPHGVEGIVLDFREDEVVTLNLSEFTKLRILVIRNGRLTKVPNLPNNIRWLEWHDCSFRSIPLGFLPAELVILEMPHSCIVHLLKRSLFERKGKKFLNLTRMDFSVCEYLRDIVDFSAIPNLEVMDLNRCKNLKKIDVSIGNLKKLKALNLSECCSLTSLPNLVDNQCLQCIDLEDCLELNNLPNLPTTLTRLNMTNSGIKEIPSFIGNLINLTYIDASNCKNLICVSNSIYKLPYIHTLYLNNCPNLPRLPGAESSMVSSSCISRFDCWLELSGNKFVSLPINTFKFIQISFLYLDNCEWLVEIPELPKTLRWLKARNCKSLVRFSQFQFENFSGDFSNCHKIIENEMQSWREIVQNLSLTRMKLQEEREYSITLLGNEIPEWFSYSIDCEGNDPSFKLRSPLLNDNLIGIAWCAIFEDPTSNGIFQIKFSMNDFTIYKGSLHSPLESEHMLLGFISVFDLPKLLQAEEISCEVHCNKDEVVFKRLGVHFIYKN